MEQQKQWLSHRRLVALQYFAHIPPRDPSFHWPNSRVLVEIQEEIYRDLSLQAGPGEEGDDDGLYKKAFLKELIRHIEKGLDEVNDAEISGDLLEAYVSSMSINNAASIPKNRTMIYRYPTHDSVDRNDLTDPIFEGWNEIILSEDGSMIAKGTTGLKTWEASLRLAAHLLVDRETVLDRDISILELGSGSGLLGTIVAKECGSKSNVTLTDIDGIVLDQLQKTVDRNLASHRNVKVAALDWLSITDDSSKSAQMMADLQPHVILGADIVYDPVLMDPLCQVLKAALSCQSKAEQAPIALIASTVRNQETFALFELTLGKKTPLASEKYGLHARPKTISRPRLDLERGVITLTPGEGELDLFPTAHCPSRDGDIHLLHVTTA